MSSKRKNIVDANIVDAYVNATTYENESIRERVRTLLHALANNDDMRVAKKLRRELRALNHRDALNIVVRHHFATHVVQSIANTKRDANAKRDA